MELSPIILLIIAAACSGLGFIVGMALGGALRESARADEYSAGYVAGTKAKP
jgi:hydrogenase/urease accessory protein HupE